MRYRNVATGAVISVPKNGTLVAAAVAADSNWQPDERKALTDAQSGDAGRRSGGPAAGTDRKRAGVDRRSTGRVQRPRRRVSAPDADTGPDTGPDHAGNGGGSGGSADPSIDDPT